MSKVNHGADHDSWFGARVKPNRDTDYAASFDADDEDGYDADDDAYDEQDQGFQAGFEEPAPAPVFVDQSGLRGRLLRGFGWPVSVVGAVLAIAMGSSLIGVQADAPAMGIPAQPSVTPAPSASPGPSLSPSPSASPSPSSSAHAGTKSGTPQTKSSATTTKPTTTVTHGATPSGQPTKRA